MELSLFFVGTGGSAPAPHRGMPALLVRRGGERLLFDCGEGTQRQLVRSIGLLELDCIFVTHFHADHWLGLPGLLKTYALRDRRAPLRLFGPPGTRKVVEAVRFIYGALPFPLEVDELAPLETVRFAGYGVTAIPVRHREPAHGYVLVEDPRPGEFNPAAAQALGVEPGPEFGRLQRGEVVRGVRPEQVMGPPRLGRKVVLSGDTGPCEALAVAAHQADLLVHEATFLEEDRDRANQTNHSTARQAATVAKEAAVRLLALVHASGRYPARAVREEAQAVFPGAVLARDFDLVEIPFPERGAPRLVAWDQGGDGAAARADKVAGEVL